jgi:hypothetical protein
LGHSTPRRSKVTAPARSGGVADGDLATEEREPGHRPRAAPKRFRPIRAPLASYQVNVNRCGPLKNSPARLTSLVIAQLAESPELETVFGELFAAGRDSGEVVIGYRRNSESEAPVVNPSKGTALVLQAEDEVIVIARTTVTAPTATRPTAGARRGPRTGRKAVVKKQLIGIGEKYNVDIEDGDDLKVKGDFVGHEYTIECDDDTVAEVSKKWFRVRESYGIEVQGDIDPALVIAVAVAVDSLND